MSSRRAERRTGRWSRCLCAEIDFVDELLIMLAARTSGWRLRDCRGPFAVRSAGGRMRLRCSSQMFDEVGNAESSSLALIHC